MSCISDWRNTPGYSPGEMIGQSSLLHCSLIGQYDLILVPHWSILIAKQKTDKVPVAPGIKLSPSEMLIIFSFCFVASELNH